MRRRPPSRGTPSISRAVPAVSANSEVTSDSLEVFLDILSDGSGKCTAGPGYRESASARESARESAKESAKESQEPQCRSLQDAIDQVTQKFEEAQQEYQGVATSSPDWHKWKGEMIAYANVVALLEDLKSRYVLIR